MRAVSRDSSSNASVFKTLASTEVPKGIIPRTLDQKVNVATGRETLDPKVDILFVIDDSGSMGTHQDNLSQNVNKFVTSFFGKIQLDFHIGVITTSDDSNDGGKLVGSPSFIDKNTPGYQGKLAQRMIVGTGGSATEKVFDPIKKALSEPNLSGVNLGFFRPGAYLAIVVITDTEDQSNLNTASGIFTFLIGATGKADRILNYGVIVPTNPTQSDCSGEGEIPTQLQKFLAMSVTAGQNSFSLCAADFGDKLSQMGQDLAKRVGNIMPLARIPIPSTIEVKYGTQTVLPGGDSGWSFDPEQNAIVFGSNIEWTEQVPGTKITVQYDYTEYKDTVAP